MATINKPVLGYIQCDDCGERGSIHQAAGRRKQLYQRCGCGCVQSNGKLVQSRMWYDTEWLHDLKPDSPPLEIYTQAEYSQALADSIARRSGRQLPPVNRPKPANKPANKPDFVPDDDKKPADIGDKKTGLYWLAGGVAVLAAMVGRI